MTGGVARRVGSEALRDWDSRAGVRTDPRRTVSAHDLEKAFFPAALIPHLHHPMVKDAPEDVRRVLTAQHLYQYLRFTASFETRIVNRAAEKIANGRTGLELERDVRMDAYRIYCDEGYHALYSHDMLDQIATLSGISPLPYDFDPFLTNLEAIGADHPQHRRLIELLQVIVFETLITSLLVQIPTDETVMDPVRAIVRDHAEDEGRHHAFFAGFFDIVWSAVDDPTRRLVAPFLPHLILRSLQPPTGPARLALIDSGFTAGQSADIIAQSYSPAAVLNGIRNSATRTIGLFTSRGVLDDPRAHDEFARLGLIDG